MHVRIIEKNSAYFNPFMNFIYQIEKTFVAVPVVLIFFT